ncbi:MAG: hypothetical protein J6A08_13570 [Lachnospiraceae bacterium]|nr:hypothetical protein [Lachnospiraceae bacterium]
MGVVFRTIVSEIVEELVCEAILWLRELWDNRVKAPDSLLVANLSKTDRLKQKQTKQIIHGVLGEDPIQEILKMNAADRIHKMEEVFCRLVECYDLNVTADFYGDSRDSCGYFDGENNILSLNVADLLSKNPEYVKEFLDTMIHELRHAIQQKAIRTEGFWDIEETRRLEWRNNYDNYIEFEVDPQGYARQVVEEDALTFASGCLKGVY